MNRNNHREKLQNRKIKPSSGSWEQLEKELGAQEDLVKKDKWRYLKIASMVLVLISISYYYFSPDNDIDNMPVIAAPSIKKERIDTPENNILIESEVASTDDITPIQKGETDKSNTTVSKKTVIPSKDSFAKSSTSNDILIEVAINDSITGIIEMAEIPISDEQLLDEEVEQLLRESKIKLVVNGQIASKKVVSSADLLSSVEEDLYKDLKQQLIEKITSRLKNPKEVVTSREK